MVKYDFSKYRNGFIRALIFLTYTLIGYIIYRFTYSYLMPFVLALILSFIIEPFVKFFQKLHIKRGPAVFLSIILVFGGLITIFVFTITKISVELIHLYNRLPNYFSSIYNLISNLTEQAKGIYLQLPPEALNVVREVLKVVFEKVTVIFSRTTSSIIEAVSSLPSFFIFILVTTIATFFITKDRALIKDFVFRQFPQNWRVKLTLLKEGIFNAAIGYVRAYSIILSVTFLESFIGLTILNIEYALTMAMIIAVFDILPVLGAGGIYVPWAVLNAIWGNYKLAIGLLILYAVITVVRNMIEPKVLGEQLGIHPLAVLIAIFLGLKIIGVSGIIIGPIIMVLIRSCQNAGIIPKFK